MPENAKSVSGFLSVLAVLAAAIVPAIDKLRSPKAKAIIDAPAAVAAGPVIVHGHQSTGQQFEWSANAPFQTVDDGKSVALNVCGPGVYHVALRVKTSAGARYSEDVATASIVVGNAPPGPVPPGPPPGPIPPGPLPPGPTPPPVPPGPVPDGRFKLARVSYDAAMKLQRPTRQQEARAAAAALRGVVKQVEDKKLSGVVPIAGAMVRAYESALGSARAAWQPVRDEIGGAMKGVLRLGSPDKDVADALAEVATGLEAVTQ